MIATLCWSQLICWAGVVPPAHLADMMPHRTANVVWLPDFSVTVENVNTFDEPNVSNINKIMRDDEDDPEWSEVCHWFQHVFVVMYDTVKKILEILPTRRGMNFYMSNLHAIGRECCGGRFHMDWFDMVKIRAQQAYHAKRNQRKMQKAYRSILNQRDTFMRYDGGCSDQWPAIRGRPIGSYGPAILWLMFGDFGYLGDGNESSIVPWID